MVTKIERSRLRSNVLLTRLVIVRQDKESDVKVEVCERVMLFMKKHNVHRSLIGLIACNLLPLNFDRKLKEGEFRGTLR